MSSCSALSEKEKTQVLENLEVRRRRHSLLCKNKLSGEGSILIVGDRPGPAAPADPAYHHTPFYSTKHCSGWLNAQLLIAKIPENKLMWINSADKDGNPTDPSLIKNLDPDAIIALGKNAEKWLISNGIYDFHRVDHPQFHKRFKSKSEYKLISLLKLLTKHQAVVS